MDDGLDDLDNYLYGAPAPAPVAVATVPTQPLASAPLSVPTRSLEGPTVNDISNGKIDVVDSHGGGDNGLDHEMDVDVENDHENGDEDEDEEEDDDDDDPGLDIVVDEADDASVPPLVALAADGTTAATATSATSNAAPAASTTATGTAAAAPAALANLDLDSIDQLALYDGKPITGVPIESFEDKPWRRPGEDLSDYFNYGFNEDSWRMYCDRQRAMRDGSAAVRYCFCCISCYRA
ncbi:Fip1 motif-domain-containing protein [Blastocladiella britannica]|nr:Fip1 motif-domain-containing protein [Blastocladiella britannica]